MKKITSGDLPRDLLGGKRIDNNRKKGYWVGVNYVKKERWRLGREFSHSRMK